MHLSSSRGRTAGFTLLELLVVLAIIAFATLGVSLSLRDGQADALERDALRLVAILEAARAESRASAVPLAWRLQPGGFNVVGAVHRPDAADSLHGPRLWLTPDIQAWIQEPPGATELQLGPEPLLPAQRVVLRLGPHRVDIGSDGLRPFRIQAPTTAAPAPPKP
jgi:general secretion pathway protein H